MRFSGKRMRYPTDRRIGFVRKVFLLHYQNDFAYNNPPNEYPSEHRYTYTTISIIRMEDLVPPRTTHHGRGWFLHVHKSWLHLIIYVIGIVVSMRRKWTLHHTTTHRTNSIVHKPLAQAYRVRIVLAITRARPAWMGEK